MSIRFGIADEINAEVSAARITINQGRQVARAIAPLLVGALHGIECNTLAALKRELERFDLRSKKWKR